VEELAKEENLPPRRQIIEPGVGEFGDVLFGPAILRIVLRWRAETM